MKLRTKLLGVLLLVSGLVLLLIPRSPSTGSEPPFMSVGKIIGMDTEGAREILGEPEEEKANNCGTVAYPTIGDLWYYLYETETTVDELDVCVYKGFVVGQKRTEMIAEEGEVSIREQELVAAELLQMLILMDEAPDLSTYEEPPVEI